MPSRRELEQQLGTYQKTYRFNVVKAILNSIIAGGLLLAGGVLAVGQISAGFFDAFALLGIALFLIGLAMAILLYRQTGTNIQLFENGVYSKRRGKTRAWLFGELDDLMWTVGRASAKPTSIRAQEQMHVFAGDESAFSLMSDVARWREAADTIQERMTATHVSLLLERLQKGEVIRFDKVITGEYFAPRPFPLAISEAGITLPDGSVVAWEGIRTTLKQDNWGTLIAIIKHPRNEFRFNMENSRQSWLAYRLIVARAKK